MLIDPIAQTHVIVDEPISIGGGVPSVGEYHFLALVSPATLKGFFTDIFGNKTGVAASLSIPVGTTSVTPVTWDPCPANAVGFVGDLDQPISYSIYGNPSDPVEPGATISQEDDFKANCLTRFPSVVASKSICFGRISVK